MGAKKNTLENTNISKAGRGTRRANVTSANQTRFAYWAMLIASLMIVGALTTYFYINRERAIIELVVAAGPYKSDSYELMQEIADVTARQSEFLRIKVLNTKDSSQNISILNKQKVDLATIRSDTPVVANIRMVADLFPDYFQIIAGDKTQIFNITDLKNKTVAIPAFGTDEFRSFWAVADHYDISATAVNWKSMPFVTAGNKLLSGEIDAIFTVRSLRDRLILNLYEDASLKHKNLKLIEIEQAEAISVKRPFLKSRTIPKGTYSGAPPAPSRDIISTSVTRTLVSRQDVDPEVIKELTKILFENRLDLVIRFSLASAIQKPNLDMGTSVPLHEGAENYYNRNEPSFLQENAEPIALMITIAAMVGSALIALRSKLMSGQKNRMDSYNYMLLDIADQARKSDEIEVIKSLKDELYSILETVVRALDTDEVTEEGFQSFSLLWESVREVLNERRSDIA